MTDDNLFPDDFLWGSATASHQVEGGNEGNDWWRWEQEEGRIRDGEASGDAAGWWDGRAEGDLSEAAALGQNAHRMSLEWSRLEPEPGEFDTGAFDRYREILEHARGLGLQTLVTLHHFTLPLWAADREAWLWPELPRRFELFSEECARRLGHFVDLWATINEPNVHAYSAYVDQRWPPGTGSLRAGFRAMGRMLEGHRLAYGALHRVLDDAQVGIVMNLPLFEPARPHHRLDRLAAWLQDWCFSGALLHALRTGRLRAPLTIRPRRHKQLAGSYDFFGLNYYGRFEVRFDLGAPTPLGRHVQEPTTRTEWTDWGQVHAPGLTSQLERLGRLGVPLYVTENGLYDNSDEKRPQFLVEHVGAVEEALRRGVDVRGYFHWSLVDNFEWAEGWSTHFGLLELNRETGERRRRRSAEVYARICRSGGSTRDAG